jgi:glycosyltransferase involved in cell wall biosynthesis
MALPFPRASVILPVFNGSEYLQESIDSILNQTMTDFELIIVDDGSSDGSDLIAKSYKDPRVVFIGLDVNVGLSKALNIGVSHARAPLIARQDQDDLSAPTRLEQQITYLQMHENVVLVGSWAEIVKLSPTGEWVTSGFHRHPSSDSSLRFRLLWNNPFVHSSVVFRKSAFEQVGGYCIDPIRGNPEDFELWSRIMNVGRLSNIPEVLVTYRHSDQGLSKLDTKQIKQGVRRIAADNLIAAGGLNSEDPDVDWIVSCLNGYKTSRRSFRRLIYSLGILWKAAEYICQGSRAPLLGQLVGSATKLTVRAFHPRNS